MNAIASLYQDRAARDILEHTLTQHIFQQQPDTGRELIGLLKAATAWANPYPDLHNAVHTHALIPQASSKQARVNTRLAHVDQLISDTPAAFLDLGAGNGEITSGLRQHWGVDGHDAFAIDVAQYMNVNDVTALAYGGHSQIPLPSSSLDLVTCFMVLHHVEEQRALLQEVYRVLKPGGTLLVRETDAKTKAFRRFNQVCEDLFYQVFSHNPDVPNPYRHASDNYWRALLTSVGFELAAVDVLERHNPFTPVYYTLRKPYVMTSVGVH